MASEVAAGLIIASLSMEATEEEVVVEDHLGEVSGLSLGNQMAEINAEGVTSAAATQGQTLGAAMGTLGNLAIFGTDTTVTAFFILQVRLNRVNKQWEQGGFRAKGWAGLTDTVATEVT